jgi:putative flippase GtrA
VLTGRTTARFAAVGVVNTTLDLTLFLLLHHPVGVVAANLLSTSAGMAFSFVANGRFTFAGRLTARSAALFLAATGITVWAVQPVVIESLLLVQDSAALAKLAAIAVSVTANYAAYRRVVWPTSDPRPSGPAAVPSAARR